jgi:hypothetical protein
VHGCGELHGEVLGRGELSHERTDEEVHSMASSCCMDCAAHAVHLVFLAWHATSTMPCPPPPRPSMARPV